jgi:hypothetical protein
MLKQKQDALARINDRVNEDAQNAKHIRKWQTKQDAYAYFNAYQMQEEVYSVSAEYEQSQRDDREEEYRKARNRHSRAHRSLHGIQYKEDERRASLEKEGRRKKRAANNM